MSKKSIIKNAQHIAMKLLYIFFVQLFCYIICIKTLFAIDSVDFLRDTIAKIKANYIREIDDKKLIDGALEGMLPALDPHSAYLDPKSFDEISSMAQGEFGGIGVELIFDRGALRLVSPYEDSPAFKAGMRANDIIIGINEKKISDIEGGVYKAIEELRGQAGSVVVLKVLKENGQIREYKITREIIKIPSINVKLVANKSIAYIKIKRFNGKTALSVQKEFENLKRMANKRLDGIIIDLRWNPGGLLDQAIDVADLFLSDRNIVSIRGRDKETEITYRANEGDISDALPMVVIINSGTASAGEIVAGALQDNKRALILGIRSFGKGSIQRIIPLSNGGALKLTTDIYYTPNENAIQANGIVPDIVVEEAVVNPVKSTDVISEASLKGHIVTQTQTPAEIINANKELKKNQKNEKINNINQLEQTKQGIKEVDSAALEKVIGDERQDFQLMRAIDTIKGMSLYKNNEINDDTKNETTKNSSLSEEAEENEG